MGNQSYTLREKKFARTKVGLMNAFMERLQNNRFDDISIKEVCQSAEVAEGTFFNYFPEKIDVINYYLQLITIKMVWKSQQETPKEKFLPLINSLFKQMTEELINTNVIYQVISVLLVQNEKPKKTVISDLEKKLAFPNCEGIESIPPAHLDDWMREYVTAALKHGELPPKTNVDDVTISIMAIAAGTLLAVKFVDTKSRGYHYKRQLEALWKGLCAVSQ